MTGDDRMGEQAIAFIQGVYMCSPGMSIFAGCVVVPLAEAARSGIPYTFTLPVLKGAQHRGTLTGQFQIVWPPLGGDATRGGVGGSSDVTRKDSPGGGGCCTVQ